MSGDRAAKIARLVSYLAMEAWIRRQIINRIYIWLRDDKRGPGSP